MCADAPLFDLNMEIVTIEFHLYFILSSLPLSHSVLHDIMNNQKGWTALHRAARQGHADVVNLLLERVADIEAVAGPVSHCMCVYSITD